jgi:hypothetical protein
MLIVFVAVALAAIFNGLLEVAASFPKTFPDLRKLAASED